MVYVEESYDEEKRRLLAEEQARREASRPGSDEINRELGMIHARNPADPGPRQNAVDGIFDQGDGLRADTPYDEGIGMGPNEFRESENRKQIRETAQFTQDLIEGKFDAQIEEQKKAAEAAAKQAEKEARQQGPFGTQGSSDDAEYNRRVAARAAGELPEQVAKQQQVQQRIANRREGYEQRRLARQQRDAARRSGTTQTDTPRSTDFPTGISTSRGMNVAMTTASVNGQTRPILSNDPNRTLSPSEWQQTFADGDTAAIEAFDNTAEFIGTLDTPKARQWNEKYQEIQQQIQSIESNEALTPTERRQAMADLNSRRARLAASVPDLGDLGEQSERQEIQQERDEQSQNLRESKQKLTDIANVVKAADARRDAQEAQGIPVSNEQYENMLRDEYQRRQRAAQVAQDLIDGKTEAEDADETVEGDLNYSDANGGLIPYSEDGVTKFRNATTPGMSIPSKRIGGTIYPAPANDAQIKSLPSGSVYYDQNTGGLNVSKLGPKSPRERFEESRAQFEAEQIQLAEETSERVHYQMEKDYNNGMEAVRAGVALINSKNSEYNITEEQLMRGDLTGVSMYDRSAFSTSDMTKFMNVPPDPNSDEGRKMIAEQVRQTLERKEIARREAMRHAAERNEKLAPYANASSNYQTIVSGNEILVQADNDEQFEAYVINQKNSEFVGTAVPIFDDGEDLQRAGFSALNTAYYNPTAGRVIAPNFPRNEYSGTMSATDFDNLYNAMMRAYPGLLTTVESQRAMFNQIAEHSGYDGSQNF